MKEIKLSSIRRGHARHHLMRLIDRLMENGDLDRISLYWHEDHPVKGFLYLSGYGCTQDITQNAEILSLGSNETNAREHLLNELWQIDDNFEKYADPEKMWFVRVPVKQYEEHLKFRYGDKCAAIFMDAIRNGNMNYDFEFSEIVEAYSFGRQSELPAKYREPAADEEGDS